MTGQPMLRQARMAALLIWQALPARYADPAWWQAELGPLPRPAPGTREEAALSAWLRLLHPGLAPPAGPPPADAPLLPDWLWQERDALQSQARQLGLRARARALVRVLGRAQREVVHQSLGDTGFADLLECSRQLPELSSLLPLPGSSDASEAQALLLRAALQGEALQACGLILMARWLEASHGAAEAERLRLRWPPAQPCPEAAAALPERLSPGLQGELRTLLEGGGPKADDAPLALAACFHWPRPPLNPALAPAEARA